MAMHEGLNYRQWQKRNSRAFRKLSTVQQKEIRSRGYRNVGWNNVRKSWKILHDENQPVSLFEQKLKRGDISGAINHSLIEAENAKTTAQEGLQGIERKHQEMEKLASSILEKYPDL